jgi:ribonuclease P protein component
MLKKQNRLGRLARKKEDKLFTFPLFNLRISDNGEKITKFAFIVSKKIDKRAVVRNRTKRVLRSAAEEIIKKYQMGKNIIIVSKKALVPGQKEEVESDLETIIKKTADLK